MWRLLCIVLLSVVRGGQAASSPQVHSVPEKAILDAPVGFTQFCTGGKYAMAATNTGFVYVWNTVTGKLKCKFDASQTDESHPKIFKGITVTPDGKYVFLVERYVRKWDVDTKPGLQVEVWEQFGYARNLALSPDGKYFLVSNYSDDDNIPDMQLCSAKTGEVVYEFHKNYGYVRALSISSDDKWLLIGGSDSLVHLLDAKTGREIRQFKGLTGGISSVAFSPKGDNVLAGGARKAGLWQTATGKTVHVWEGLGNSWVSVAYSPDGRYVVTAMETARLWDVATGKLVQTYPHKGGIGSVAFSPDGKYLITGGYDATARLWNVTTGKQIRFFQERD